MFTARKLAIFGLFIVGLFLLVVCKKQSLLTKTNNAEGAGKAVSTELLDTVDLEAAIYGQPSFGFDPDSYAAFHTDAATKTWVSVKNQLRARSVTDQDFLSPLSAKCEWEDCLVETLNFGTAAAQRSDRQIGRLTRQLKNSTGKAATVTTHTFMVFHSDSFAGFNLTIVAGSQHSLPGAKPAGSYQVQFSGTAAKPIMTIYNPAAVGRLLQNLNPGEADPKLIVYELMTKAAAAARLINYSAADLQGELKAAGKFVAKRFGTKQIETDLGGDYCDAGRDILRSDYYKEVLTFTGASGADRGLTLLYSNGPNAYASGLAERLGKYTLEVDQNEPHRLNSKITLDAPPGISANQKPLRQTVYRIRKLTKNLHGTTSLVVMVEQAGFPAHKFPVGTFIKFVAARN